MKRIPSGSFAAWVTLLAFSALPLCAQERNLPSWPEGLFADQTAACSHEDGQPLALVCPGQNLAGLGCTITIGGRQRGSSGLWDRDTPSSINVDTKERQITLNGQKIPGSSWIWATSGSNALFNSGNVGIGTAEPKARLDVNGPVGFDGRSIRSDGKGVLSFARYDTTGLNLKGLSLTNYSGDSLIPVDTLHIHSPGIYSGLWLETSQRAGSAYIFLDTTHTRWIVVNSDDIEGTRGYFNIMDATDGKLHRIITASPNTSGGKVGIGVNEPAYKLDVAGDINFTGKLYQNGTAFSGGLPNGKILDSKGRAVINTSFGADPQWHPDSDYIINITSGRGEGNGAHMGLSGDGQIGLVMTSYKARSIWEVGVNADDHFGGNNDPGFFLYHAGTGIVLYAKDEKIGLGTLKPQYKLDVVGDINFTGKLLHNGATYSGGGSVSFDDGKIVSDGAGGLQAKTLTVTGDPAAPNRIVNGGLIVTGSAVTSGTSTTIVSSGANQLLLVPQQGDLSMGGFTAGAKPR